MDDGNFAGSLESPEGQEILKQIQQTILLNQEFRSRYSEARENRKYHTHHSPKARARKKTARKSGRSSRQRNR